VYEAEHGEVTSVSKIRHPVPVEEYLRPQKRFAHLFAPKLQAEVIAALQQIADRNIRKFNLLNA
jgi:pyruvate ferredoxin oxidoreductase beta subunit